MKRSTLVSLILAFLAFEALLIVFVDQPLSEFLRTVDAKHRDYIDFFRSFTDLGKAKWFLLLSAFGVGLCVFVVRIDSLSIPVRRKAAAIGQGLMFFFCCVAASGLFTDVAKRIIGRSRPVLLDRNGLYTLHPISFASVWNSMPSGHATTAFTIACVLSFYFPRAQIVWLLFAAIIGVSRIMVNAHYFSDVCAGAMVGFITVALMRRLINLNVIDPLVVGIFPINRKT